MKIFSETNRHLTDAAMPTGTAGAAAEKVTGRKGFTLKVDGVLLAPTDKVPTGDVYEVVECSPALPDAEPESDPTSPDEGL